MVKVLLMILVSQIRIGPYLSWDDSTNTTIRITWHSFSNDTNLLVLGIDSLTDTLRDSVPTRVHSFKLTDLNPGTCYIYKVIGSSYFSSTYSFKTSSSNPDSVVFAVFGDTRSNANAHSMVVNAIIQVNPEFALNTGDLVSNDGNASEWYSFFHIERDLLHDVPLMPCLGNHDYPPDNYFSFFYLPENEEYYSFEYGNVLFVALNTEARNYSTQRTYLENKLREASYDPNKWLIVYFHRPPYSWGGHGSDPLVRSAFCDVMENYGVKLVFNGHNHFYQRTVPINGVTYIVTGGGGAPLYNPGWSSLVAYAEACYHFVLVKATQNELSVKTIRANDGAVIDSFTIHRTGVNEHIIWDEVGAYDFKNSARIFDISGRLIGNNFKDIRKTDLYLIERKDKKFVKLLIVR